MPAPLSKLKGVSPELATKFRERGLTTTTQLLAVAGTPEGRDLLAAQANVKSSVVFRLIKRADLLRIEGIGDVYVDLLERAGVDSIQKLAGSYPENLYADIMRVNITNKVTRRPPTLTKVRRWVAQAGQLPEIVQY
jgi:predicted flap endonuclease-1-like 5' DNA nuclease